MKRLLPIVLISSFISFVICLVFTDRVSDGFFAVTFYPIVYCICFFTLYHYAKDKNVGGRITACIYLSLQWLRLVLLPALGSISGYFDESLIYISQQTAEIAAWLLVWEAAATTVVVCIILRYSPQKQRLEVEKEYSLFGNSWIYTVFIFAAFVLYLLRGRGMYTLLRLNLDSTRASQQESDSTSLILSSVIGFGLSFFVINSLYFLYRRYNWTKKKKYFVIAIAIAILRILIISTSSESRFSVVYSMGSLLLLLPLLFPEKKRPIYRNVLIAAIAVIGLMTVYKVFRAFLYGSYTEAFRIGADRFDLEMASSQIDVYFYGVRNVAKNIAISQNIELTTSTFLNDIVRNTFGVNFFIGDINDTTILKYNMYIYGGKAAAGHLYSSASYGYVFFGFVLAPVATSINLLLCSWTEKLLSRIRYIDIFYVLSAIFVRFCVSMFACFSFAWNYISRTFVIGAIIIGGAAIFTKRYRINYHSTTKTNTLISDKE